MNNVLFAFPFKYSQPFNMQFTTQIFLFTYLLSISLFMGVKFSQEGNFNPKSVCKFIFCNYFD